MQPKLSVILPANNEADHIGECLDMVLNSNWQLSAKVGSDAELEIIVVANACSDETVSIAESYKEKARKAGWSLIVLDLAEGGKIMALNAGDAVARAGIRIYLDADVQIEPDLIAQVYAALSKPGAAYCSGTINITAGNSFASRAYRNFYARVPFMTTGTPGCGLFAVNPAGRGRWGDFPDIISDDTFVRLQFKPKERITINAEYSWPIVEGYRNLVRVRRRQDAGVREISQKYPELLGNDGKARMGVSLLVKTVFRYPLGFLVYASVAIVVRLTKNKSSDNWSRGR